MLCLHMRLVRIAANLVIPKRLFYFCTLFAPQNDKLGTPSDPPSENAYKRSV